MNAKEIARQIEDLPFRLYVVARIDYLHRLGVEITAERLGQIIAIEQGQFDDRQARRHREVPTGPAVRLSQDRRSVEVETPKVYYVRLGNLVKIGSTTNLRNRMRNLNPEQILATEDGHLGLERQRHKQFHELRHHGEWFRYEGRLVEHIAALRRGRS